MSDKPDDTSEKKERSRAQEWLDMSDSFIGVVPPQHMINKTNESEDKICPTCGEVGRKEVVSVCSKHGKI